MATFCTCQATHDCLQAGGWLITVDTHHSDAGCDTLSFRDGSWWQGWGVQRQDCGSGYTRGWVLDRGLVSTQRLTKPPSLRRTLCISDKAVDRKRCGQPGNLATCYGRAAVTFHLIAFSGRWTLWSSTHSGSCKRANAPLQSSGLGTGWPLRLVQSGIASECKW